MPEEQTQTPPGREWPDDFPDWLLGLAIFLSGVLAVTLPIYSPSLWTDHNLPSYVPFIVGVAGSLAALGHGIWVGVVLWQRHRPRTQWRRVRQHVFTGSLALLTLWAASTGSLGWTVLFAVLLSRRLAVGRADVVWQRLAWLERHVAYQGSLGVRLNVRRALEHPVVRTYFIESHPNLSHAEGAYEAWIEARCAELVPQQRSDLKDGWVTANWVFDCFSVYKDGEPQFARVIFHEISLGAKRGFMATEWDDVTLRLCILNGCLKLQVGVSEGSRLWTDIVALPLYAWVDDHKLPSVFMNFDVGLETSPRQRLSGDGRAEGHQVVQRVSDYERYLTEIAHERRYPCSWFSSEVEEIWRRERTEWLRTSGAEDISSKEPIFADLGKCLLIPFLMEVGFRGGANQRDRNFDHALRVWREDNHYY